MYSEKDMTALLWTKKLRGASLRQIAKNVFDDKVTHTDVARALRGEYPKSKRKRKDMLLEDSQSDFVVSIDVVLPRGESPHIPPNAVIIRCATCATWFVRCHPRQKYCRPECRKS